MSFKTVFFICGLLLNILGLFMLVPAIVSFFTDAYDWTGFAVGAATTLFIGVLMVLANQQSRQKMVLGPREAFLLTTMCWLFSIAFAALPFMFRFDALSPTDAFFEAASALTTTGATVIKNLDAETPGLLLWRSLLHALGGVGIIVMALTVLPLLRIGGMQLFRLESSDRSEKILPRVSQIAKAILTTQAVFAIAFTIALWIVGLTPLEALCHSLSALNTGGFSTSDGSVGGLSNPAAEVILIVAMFVGSCTLILFIKAWHGDWRALWEDPQIRGLTKIIFFGSLVMTVWRYLHTPDPHTLTLLRESVFTILSVVSSTGFTTADYSTWGDFALLLIMMMTFIGGCTGSTSGGVKIFRLQVLWVMLKNQLAQLRHPHGVFLPHYKNQVLNESVINSVFTFLSLFGLTYGALVLALGFCGVDVVTSLSAAAAVITSTGTGIGPVINPAGSFAPLNDPAKWVCMIGMVMGRLELMTVIVLFSPKFWRQ